LIQKQAAFDRLAWLTHYAPQALSAEMGSQRRLISLLCYEPSSLQVVLMQLAKDDIATTLLVTQGRSQQAVAQALQALQMPNNGSGSCKLNNCPISAKKISTIYSGPVT
jgi:hypothetical protein